ncbi:MAG: sulfite exporter TauE/SafE family protein [Myxococcota bacterium]
MTPGDAALLAGGGLLAGVVNTLAGGGSLLTVPLLVLVGLPGTLANGSNRVGVLLQSGVAVWRFRAEGVPGLPEAGRLLIPVLAGSLLGAFAIAQVDAATFERLFGFLMLLLLFPTLRSARSRPTAKPWPPAVRHAVFFAIGLYGGALQAGVGLVLVAALSHAGFDLVRANSIKLVVILALTAVAVPVFVLKGQVAWAPAAALGVGFAAGGELGARLALRGGERLIRPVLLVAVLALAGRMLGLY